MTTRTLNLLLLSKVHPKFQWENLLKKLLICPSLRGFINETLATWDYRLSIPQLGQGKQQVIVILSKGNLFLFQQANLKLRKWLKGTQPTNQYKIILTLILVSRKRVSTTAFISNPLREAVLPQNTKSNLFSVLPFKQREKGLIEFSEQYEFFHAITV